MPRSSVTRPDPAMHGGRGSSAGRDQGPFRWCRDRVEIDSVGQGDGKRIMTGQAIHRLVTLTGLSAPSPRATNHKRVAAAECLDVAPARAADNQGDASCSRY